VSKKAKTGRRRVTLAQWDDAQATLKSMAVRVTDAEAARDRWRNEAYQAGDANRDLRVKLSLAEGRLKDREATLDSLSAECSHRGGVIAALEQALIHATVEASSVKAEVRRLHAQVNELGLSQGVDMTAKTPAQMAQREKAEATGRG